MKILQWPFSSLLLLVEGKTSAPFVPTGCFCRTDGRKNYSHFMLKQNNVYLRDVDGNKHDQVPLRGGFLLNNIPVYHQTMYSAGIHEK